MKPKELTIRGLILGALIFVLPGLVIGDAPIALVPEDFGREWLGFAIGPLLGVLGFVGILILLYSWMLRRTRMAPER